MPHAPHPGVASSLIGAIGGLGLGFLGAQAQQKQQNENNTADMLTQAALKDPSILQDPEVQKLLTKRRGKDYVGFLTQIGKANQATMASFPGAGGAPQGGPAPQGTVPAGGAPPTPASGASPPPSYTTTNPWSAGSGLGGAVPGMIGAAGGTPMGGGGPAPGGAPMSSGVPTAGAPNPSGRGPTPSPMSTDDRIDQLMGHIKATEQWAREHPDDAETAKMAIEDDNKTIDQLQKRRDSEGSLAERISHDKETEADRKIAEAGIKATRDATRTNAEAMKTFNEDMKKKDFELKKTKGEDDRKAKVAEYGKYLDTSVDKITTDFAKAPNDDVKTAFKSRADAYNASASAFYRKHADSGAPTLLKFTPAVKGTGARGIPLLGGTAGVSPTLEAVPPSYGSYKGKSGFLDADGNFYPDSGTD